MAIERLREALELDPSSFPAANDLAGLFYRSKQYKRAIELYQRALGIAPDRREPLQGLALAFIAQRDYARARRALEKLVAGDQHDAQTWLNLGDVALLAGDGAEAQRCWQQSATVDASDTETIRQARQRLATYAPPAVQPR